MLNFIIGLIVGGTVAFAFIILVAVGGDRHDGR